MIRTFINLTATCTIGLVVVAVALGACNRARGGIDAIAGGAWNHGAAAASTAIPTYAPGVDVGIVLPAFTETPFSPITDTPAFTPTAVPFTPTAVPFTPTAVPFTPTDAPDTNPLQAECDWAVSTLQEDARLDTHAGTDMPDLAGYYRTTARYWTTIAASISGSCAGAPWPARQCDRDQGRIAAARVTHVLDEDAATPMNAHDVNEMWIANYARIGALVKELCQ